MIITDAPHLCMRAHELPEERVVGDVAHRLVGAAGGVGPVEHRQKDAGHRLVEEREHRRRAERVEPVDPLAGPCGTAASAGRPTARSARRSSRRR